MIHDEEILESSQKYISSNERIDDHQNAGVAAGGIRISSTSININVIAADFMPYVSKSEDTTLTTFE